MEKFEFTSIVYPFNQKNAIKISEDKYPMESYIEYINMYKLEQAEVVMPDLNILDSCPTLKYLKIYPSINAGEDFNFSKLYDIPEIRMLNCRNVYGERYQFIGNIDFAQISGLEDLSLGVNKGTINYNKIDGLKSLSIGGFKGETGDLKDLFCSNVLDTLELRECREYALDGVEISERLQCLYISYDRNLRDISALSKVKETLKCLRIDNCSKIEDLSVLNELEHLSIWGSNSVKNLNFLKNMKNLKTFTFDINVLDGDLTPCLDLSYVSCGKCKRHYNLKEKDLPKGKYFRGNENIEIWRRLE